MMIKSITILKVCQNNYLLLVKAQIQKVKTWLALRSMISITEYTELTLANASYFSVLI
jgi:hypothetical protein